jgi:hypothetical protein
VRRRDPRGPAWRRVLIGHRRSRSGRSRRCRAVRLRSAGVRGDGSPGRRGIRCAERSPSSSRGSSSGAHERPHVTLKLAQTVGRRSWSPRPTDAGSRRTGRPPGRAPVAGRGGRGSHRRGHGARRRPAPGRARSVASRPQPRPVVFDGRLRDAAPMRPLAGPAGTDRDLGDRSDGRWSDPARRRRRGRRRCPAGRDGGVDPDAALRAVSATGDAHQCARRAGRVPSQRRTDRGRTSSTGSSCTSRPPTGGAGRAGGRHIRGGAGACWVERAPTRPAPRR